MLYLNVISIVVFIALIPMCIAFRKYIQKSCDERDGVGSIYNAKDGSPPIILGTRGVTKRE